MSIQRAYGFANFADALAFVNQAGEICEVENHHADFSLGWGRVTVKIRTHDVGGLTRSDFILAAKIDQISGNIMVDFQEVLRSRRTVHRFTGQPV